MLPGGGDAGERLFPQILKAAGSGLFALATPKQWMGGRDEGEAWLGVPGAGLGGVLGRSGQPHTSSSPCLLSRAIPPPPPKCLSPLFPRLALVSYPCLSPSAHPYSSLGIFKEKRQGDGEEESGDNEVLMGDYWCIIEQYPW